MGYSIELIDKATGNVAQINPRFVVSNIVPIDDDFVVQKQRDASIGITYNYSPYYYEATKDDKRFAHKDENDDEVKYGIRGLYGKNAKQSFEMLNNMISRIEAKYKDKNGNWLTSKRIRRKYFDKDGNEIDGFDAFLKKISVNEVVEEYEISEGDMSDYWEATAANAIQPLKDMLHMVVDCWDKNVYWSGD